MSLPHALLTSLIERPSSGLELARRFDRSIGYFWHATHQQIYRELARMESAGWVAADEVPGRGRKRVYRCLEAGRDELLRWAGKPTPATDPRDALLVRLRADAATGPLGLGEQIRDRMAHHEAALAAYRVIETRDFGPGAPSTRAARIQHLILAAGIVHEEGGLRWCRQALDTLADP
ncbi:MAG TPA: PadR family transcriptional regulator [Candidatus Lustribacter sp.]|nr:PadR family transcriptional regulator [Candidatus Lustribacter sp.]